MDLGNSKMLVSHSLRTPRAAGIAGVLFAVLLTTALIFLRLAARTRAGAETWLAHEELALVPHLIPFAGIAFLWLIGVVRDRIGQREDRFFASVFLGSGLLFVAMLFVASGVFAGVLADVASARTGAATDAWRLNHQTASALMHMYAFRMAAVFMISTATIGLRNGLLPRWLGVSGYAIAVILLLGINVTLWVELLFPGWILLLSLYILVENLRNKPALLNLEDAVSGSVPKSVTSEKASLGKDGQLKSS